MVKRRAARHFRHVFHWSSDERVETADVMAAAFGMAGPILAGMMSGHEAAGFAAALGGLAVGRVECGADVRDHVRREIEAFVPAILAAMVAVGVAVGGRLATIGLVATVMIAAVIGGFSRPMAIASTRFIIFLMIVSAVPIRSFHDGIGLLFLIALGVIWTSGLGLVFRSLMRKHGPWPQSAAPFHRPSARQRLGKLLRSMTTLTSWSYPLRLGACLSIAALMQWVWPQHHFHWIGLTVALLTSRRPEPDAVKTTQRTLGTVIGVLIAGLLLRSSLPAAALVVLIGVMAGARSHFRSRNYLAYSAVITPLVVLIIDAGRPPGVSLLSDRLLATAIGGLLVTVFEMMFRRQIVTG